MTLGSRLEWRRQDMEVHGALLWRAYLDSRMQEQILKDVERIASVAPFVRPVTPWGKPMSVEMTSAGRCGWVTDRRGYRYEALQSNGASWPSIPWSIMEVWRVLADDEREPDCCLVNRYRSRSRMGLHQDRDEGDFSHPVLSISLGYDALFRIGGTKRSDPTESVWLSSGDVIVLAREARLAYHGVDRIRPSDCEAISTCPGRINLTLRVVDTV